MRIATIEYPEEVGTVCGRFVSASPPDELARYFGAEPPEPGDVLPINYNVAPTNDIYAVREQPNHVRKLDSFHWGLVPMWAKDTKIGSRMINARGETVAQKNSFKRPLASRRCLVPADGFYEWKVVGMNDKGKPHKQPYFIHSTDGEPLAMAGLWEQWRGPERKWEEALRSVTIITTAANGFMTDIHDRMPVFLPPQAWDMWLDPGFDDVDVLEGVLARAPESLLEAHMVDPKVGKVSNKGPENTEPYTPSS
ncbi:MAG: SOS response-associated peptidase [Actinomycetia bacterium]|nr:SOS response-associated peptidase [Actinomycetes bacterium]MCP4963397.1 SOS response-associated peptidase [Actinomycetes bacterium]